MVAPTKNQIVSAFTEEQASRLSGVSESQLRYWDKTLLFTPQFADENRKAAFSRVYSFMDIAALRVLRSLTKDHSVSVQHLRQIAKKLCALDNSAWSRTSLYVLQGRVNFDDPEDGRQREVVSGQYSIGIPLEKVLSDTRRDVESLSVRDFREIGMVQRKRNISHNVPVIAGTRIPARAIKNFYEDGYSVDQIMSEYPTLKREDVTAAINYSEEDKAA